MTYLSKSLLVVWKSLSNAFLSLLRSVGSRLDVIIAEISRKAFLLLARLLPSYGQLS